MGEMPRPIRLERRHQPRMARDAEAQHPRLQRRIVLVRLRQSEADYFPYNPVNSAQARAGRWGTPLTKIPPLGERRDSRDILVRAAREWNPFRRSDNPGNCANPGGMASVRCEPNASDGSR